MDLDLKYIFLGLKRICRFEKYLLGMTLLSHRIFHLIVEKLDVFNFHPIFFYCYH